MSRRAPDEERPPSRRATSMPDADATHSANSIARRDLARIYAAAVSAVAPAYLVRRALAGEPEGGGPIGAAISETSRIRMIAAGKAAPAMAAALAERLAYKLEEGIVISPAPGIAQAQAAAAGGGHPALRTLSAAHPLPDASSERAAAAALEVASRAAAGELLLVALSGGASALLAAPAPPVTLQDKITINAALLRSGASIRELNIVRRHLSAIKGGGLLRAGAGARVLALIISDVVNNDLAAIGSGPTAADPTTYSEAIGVLKRRGLWGRAPETIRDRLERGVAGEIPETVKSGDPLLASVSNFVIGDNRLAANAAAEAAAAAGYAVERGRELGGEADEAGRTLGARLAAISAARVCVVAGGEPVVTVRGPGKGGRAQQAALAMAFELERSARGRRVAALFAGTDGIDGPTDAAGAFVTSKTIERAREAGFDPASSLARNDAYPLFAALGDLLITGPTGTNVSDIFIGLVNY